MKIFLSFDIGTTSVKGCAFDERFHRVASVNEEYALLTPRPHFVEMDPEAYWQAVTDGARRMIAGGIDPRDVACVTFTTQGETMIPVDREGKALSKAIVWLDDRAQREAALLSEAIPGDVFYRHTGVPELSAATPLAKLCWHVRQAKEIHERTYKYLLLEDWLILRMTGRFVTEQSLLSSTGYFDIVRRRYWTRALEACGVTEDRLPEPVPCGTRVGGVIRAAAEQTAKAHQGHADKRVALEAENQERAKAENGGDGSQCQADRGAEPKDVPAEAYTPAEQVPANVQEPYKQFS